MFKAKKIDGLGNVTISGKTGVYALGAYQYEVSFGSVAERAEWTARASVPEAVVEIEGVVSYGPVTIVEGDRVLPSGVLNIVGNKLGVFKPFPEARPIDQLRAETEKKMARMKKRDEETSQYFWAKKISKLQKDLEFLDKAEEAGATHIHM